MSELKTRSLPPHFRIQVTVDAAPAFPAEAEAAVRRIWEEECSLRPDLFNGAILSLVKLEDAVLTARVVEYRAFLAQMREPRLHDIFKITTLAVSGIVRLGTKLVFGRRALHSTQDAGRWELVPSGGLTPRACDRSGKLPVETQLFEELEEELGLPRTAVASWRPFLMVEDTQAHVIDIAVEAELSCTQRDVDNARERRSDEYSEVRWIEADGLAAFRDIAQANGGLSAVSLALLEAKGLLPRPAPGK